MPASISVHGHMRPEEGADALELEIKEVVVIMWVLGI